MTTMTTKVEEQRLFVPAMAGIYDIGSTISYPLIRFVAGFWLMPHGSQKLFGLFGGDIHGTAAFFSKVGIEPALTLSYVVGCTEFFGGLLVAIGFLTRPAAAAAAFMLAVAAFQVHFPNGFFWTTPGKPGFEYPLMWMFLMIAIFLRGGGNLSVDSKLGKQF
jgi:putative oxidoreductase